MTLWDFALAAWRRPGAEAVCLTLQNQHGQNPPLLLWRLWAQAEGRPVDRAVLAAAADAARRWQAEVIAPLRQARTALKTPPAAFSGAGCEALRDQVIQVEIAAERRLLEVLAELTPGPSETPAPADAGAVLCEAAAAWGGGAPEPLLRRLASLV